MSTRIKESVALPLVGKVIPNFTGNKLPSRGDVLRNLLFNIKCLNMNLRNAALATQKNLAEYWDKGGLPTKPKGHCVLAIERLYDEWRHIRKNEKTRSEGQLRRESNFQESLSDLLDIAHQDVMKLTELEEDKKFLEMQRKKGRPGFMTKLDLEHAARLVARHARKAKAANRRVASLKQSANDDSDSILSSSTVSSGSECGKKGSGGSTSSDYQIPQTTKHRLEPPKKKMKISQDLAASLDATGLSDRKASAVLQRAATSISSSNSPKTNRGLSRCTLRRNRMKSRMELAAKLKSTFKNTAGRVVIHWDGKLVEEHGEKVDRLPVIASSATGSQILVIAKLKSGTGKAQADAVVAGVKSWELEKQTCGMSFDTTGSNTGPVKGACVEIEKALNQELLWLACRRHIAEIIIKAVYEKCMGNSKRPEEKLLTDYQTLWEELDKNKFKAGVKERAVTQAIGISKDSITQFALEQLQTFQPRDDYEELLELVIIFLGEIPPKGLHFKKPGAASSARWMSRILYGLKIYMFRNQLQGTSCELTKDQINGLRDFCVFTITVYVRYWFTSPHAASAPRNDLELVKILIEYKKVNKSIADLALKKMLGHLWYLSEELVPLSLFDHSVSLNDKRGIVRNMLNRNGSSGRSVRDLSVTVKQVHQSWSNKSLADFASKRSMFFFESVGIPTTFLAIDPAEWCENKDFKNSRDVVNSLVKVTNEAAERGVALMKEFHDKFSHDEEQKQGVFLMVSHYRKKFPSVNLQN